MMMAGAMTVADLMHEYGNAFLRRPGRPSAQEMQIDLRELSAAVRKYGADPLPREEVARLRGYLVLCPHGDGHWAGHCTDSCVANEEEVSRVLDGQP